MKIFGLIKGFRRSMILLIKFGIVFERRLVIWNYDCMIYDISLLVIWLIVVECCMSVSIYWDI